MWGQTSKDFIVSFGGWLRANRWRTTPEEPAVMIYWQVEDEATVMRRAIATGLG